VIWGFQPFSIFLQRLKIKNIKMKKLTFLLIAAFAFTFAACQQKGQTATAKEAETNDSAKSVTAAGASVLVLLAHPNIGKSKANAALSKAAAEIDGVQVVNIYDYPVTADTYREAVKQAKTIVFEFPFYWMSAPHLLKQWTDEVFMVFVGEGLVRGKRLMVATTTGSEETAYQHGGRNKYTMEEYLRPFEGQANHAEMVWVKPFVVYGQSVDGAEQRLQEGCKAYKTRLGELVE